MSPSATGGFTYEVLTGFGAQESSVAKRKMYHPEVASVGSRHAIGNNHKDTEFWWLF